MVYDLGLSLQAIDGDWVWPIARSEELAVIQSALCDAVYSHPWQADQVVWKAASSKKLSGDSAWSSIRISAR